MSTNTSTNNDMDTIKEDGSDPSHIDDKVHHDPSTDTVNDENAHITDVAGIPDLLKFDNSTLHIFAQFCNKYDLKDKAGLVALHRSGGAISFFT